MATVAAFTAAGLSLVSVVLTYRLSRRSQLEQWRQNEERPVIARFFALSRETYDAWGEMADRRIESRNLIMVQQALDAGQDLNDILKIVKSEAESDHPGLDLGDVGSDAIRRAGISYQAGCGLVEKLRFEAAQLDLIAGDGVREVAGKLVAAHDAMILVHHPSGPAGWLESLSEQLQVINALHRDLVIRARADLGMNRHVEAGLPPYWRRYRTSRRLSRLRARFPAYRIEPATHPLGFVAIKRATGKRAALAPTIDQMETLLIECQIREEIREVPDLMQGI